MQANLRSRLSEAAGTNCAGPARCEHRRNQANPRGRLFFGDFLLAKQKDVTATRGMSALEACKPNSLHPPSGPSTSSGRTEKAQPQSAVVASQPR